jgi:hypothetical protein
VHVVPWKLFFSAAGVPGSDGDHNNAKSAEFNRRDCVLLIKTAKKCTKKSAAVEINGRRRGTAAPRENDQNMRRLIPRMSRILVEISSTE